MSSENCLWYFLQRSRACSPVEYAHTTYQTALVDEPGLGMSVIN